MNSATQHRINLLALDWVGSFTGLIGAFFLALNFSLSGYGWLFFLASNIAWIAYALRHKVISLLLMQIGFMATTCIGLYRWMV